MMLWVAMAVLAAAASLSVLVPLYRGGRGGRTVASGEVSVYRDQLNEIDRDLDRGLIAASEADAARTEIARRLIRADEAGGRPESPSGNGRRKVAMSLAAIGVPAIAVALYLHFGTPEMPDAPLMARVSAPDSEQDMAVLIARVEAHLAQNPDDGAGWEVIAPVYARLGRADDAAAAYANAVRLLGSTAEREANLGEALVGANGGAMTDEARSAFQRALDRDPDAVKPRFYLALALAEDGNTAEAAAAFGSLIANAPPGAPWVAVAKNILTELEGAPPAEPGPSQADIEAASSLSAGDRAAMIEGMVDQLASRLEAEPNDAAGWARLIRSYMVLGRVEEAGVALDDARTALAGQAEPLALVEAAARASGLIE